MAKVTPIASVRTILDAANTAAASAGVVALLEGEVVLSDTDSVDALITGSAVKINSIIALTQDQYGEIGSPDPNTVYLITDDESSQQAVVLRTAAQGAPVHPTVPILAIGDRCRVGDDPGPFTWYRAKSLSVWEREGTPWTGTLSGAETDHADSGGSADAGDSHADSLGQTTGAGSHADSSGIATNEASHANSGGTAENDYASANSLGIASGVGSHASSYAKARHAGSFAGGGNRLNSLQAGTSIVAMATLTTNATATFLALTNGVTSYTLPINFTGIMQVMILAKRTNGTAFGRWIKTALVSTDGAGAATITQITDTVAPYLSGGTYSVELVGSSSDNFGVRVTGEAGHNVTWCASVQELGIY